MDMRTVRRFIEKLRVEPGGCWVWTAATGGSTVPYGVFWNGEKLVLAHRWSYEQFVGPLPAGHRHVVEHLCENSMCVNPGHLSASAQSTNLLRSSETVNRQNADKTHCDNGHEFTPENTRVGTARGRPYRVCRACKREWARAHRKR